MTARNAHADFAKIARALFVSDKPALTKLGLTGRTPQATAAFLQAADTVFANALSDPALLAALSGASYDAQKLTTERAKITAMRQADAAQEAAKAQSEQATQNLNDAMTPLDKWVAQYKKIAAVALQDKPQLLEALGITVR